MICVKRVQLHLSNKAPMPAFWKPYVVNLQISPEPLLLDFVITHELAQRISCSNKQVKH